MLLGPLVPPSDMQSWARLTVYCCSLEWQRCFTLWLPMALIISWSLICPLEVLVHRSHYPVCRNVSHLWQRIRWLRHAYFNAKCAHLWKYFLDYLRQA